MRTIPSSSELLEVISDYLRNSISPMVAQPDRFYLIVAANSLDIVRREIEQGGLADAEALGRLRALLGREGDVETLDSILIDAIRNGDMPTSSPELREHLTRTALAEVAIDQPRYASYRRMVELVEKEGAAI
ncbi:MAG: DUF6285 domain-containing protein [Sphingobium sp.]